MTRKDLDALKAIVTAIEAEKAAIEARLHEAHGNYYAAEREFKLGEKPTPAMLTALTALAEPNVCLVDYNHFAACRHSYYVRDENFTRVLDVRESVFWGLKSRQAISEGEREDGVFRTIHRITEHGREILRQRIQATKNNTRLMGTTLNESNKN